MAISKSTGIGRATGRLDDKYYSVRRGRTIVSRLPGSRPVTRGSSAAQLQREAYFALISRFARMHSESINASFKRTRYGSSRNQFMKVNYTALVNAFGAFVFQSAADVDRVTDAEIEEAVTNYATANPGVIIRIDQMGMQRVYLGGAWDSIPDPSPLEPISILSVSIDGTDIPFSLTYNPATISPKNINGSTLLINTTYSNPTGYEQVTATGEIVPNTAGNVIFGTNTVSVNYELDEEDKLIYGVSVTRGAERYTAYFL